MRDRLHGDREQQKSKEITMHMFKSGLRMKTSLNASCALGLIALTMSAVSVYAADPTAVGLWQKTENKKPVVWVLIMDRGGGMFEGAIAKTFPETEEERAETCAKCVDDRKDAPVLGISFIRGMKQSGLKYENGNILDPRDGKIYKAKMSVSPNGQDLTVRGYWGISLLGKDETWQRLPDAVTATLDQSVLEKYLPAQAAALKAQQMVAKKPAVTTGTTAKPLAAQPLAAQPPATTGKRGPSPTAPVTSNAAPAK